MEIVGKCRKVLYNSTQGGSAMAKRINLLVVEDDENLCSEYEEYCKDLDDVFLIGTSGDSDEALNITKEFLPNAVVLDLELIYGRGSGVNYLLKIDKLHLQRLPYILVVTNNLSKITHAVCRNAGADFIMLKSQPDYSVPNVVNMLRSVINIIPDMNPPQKTCSPSIKKRIEDDYNKRLVQNICTELDIIGISVRHKGRKYLRDAIEMICHKEQSYICNEVAKKYSKSPASVERAMQNAINYAWSTTDITTLEEHFKARISSKKGVPSLTEFIYYYADKVKNNMENAV